MLKVSTSQGSKATNQEHLAQIKSIISYTEAHSPHYIGTGTLLAFETVGGLQANRSVSS